MINVVSTAKFLEDLGTFQKSYEGIEQKLQIFIDQKQNNPTTLIGNKDYPFSNGDLRGFNHYHLVHGRAILIYTLSSGSLRLYRIVPHKVIDKVPPKSLTDYLKTVSEFQPFSTDTNSEPPVFDRSQKLKIEDQIFELAARNPNVLTSFMNRSSVEFLELLTIELDMTISEETMRAALYNAYGGEDAFFKKINHVIKSLSHNESKKIRPLNSLLESRFGLTVDTVDVNHLEDLVRHYGERRAMLISEMGEGPALQSPDYQKAVLISETARMILKEIRPKRTKRRAK